MDSGLRRRHLRLWIVLGPMLVIGAAVLLALRPPVIGGSRHETPGRIGTGEVP